MRKTPFTILALAAGLFCTGCVALGGIDRETATIDKSVGSARNSSILLNIIRASKGEPLYFYSINQVGGSGLEDFKFNLPPFTVGPRQTIAQQNYTFGANILDSQVSGNFNVAVLDSKNFYTGMLAPLDLLEVNILLKQGFPRELVYRLVVQDVTVYWAPTAKDPNATTPPKGQLDRFVNDPNAAPAMKANFDLFLTAAMNHGITVEEYQVVSNDSKPGGDTPDSGKPAGGGAAPGGAKSGPTMTTMGRLCSDPALVSVPLEARASDDSNAWPTGPYKDVFLSGNACGARPAIEPAELTNDQGISNLQKTFQDCWNAPKPGQPAADQKTQAQRSDDSSRGANRVCARLNGQVVAVQLNTRSLYGIFRYLGQALADHSDVELTYKGDGPAVETYASGSLMNVDAGRTNGCFASVDWHGRYCIPLGEQSENLKQTFSIINALQALKTSAGDLPFTPTVRIEQ